MIEFSPEAAANEYGQAQRDARNRRQRRVTDDLRDIGPPPQIVDMARRKECGDSLETFLLTYFPETFNLSFSDDHRYLLDCATKVLHGGGQFVCAMPRGSGKTSIFQKAMIWAILYGYRRFPMLLAGDDARFKTLLSGIKTTFETNVLLFEDFPEVVHPIWALENSPLRAQTQVCDGSPTWLEWGANRIMLPTTRWSTERGNAGCSIGGGGLGGGRIRGALLTLPSGEQIRPDAVLADDPQTRRSAKSQTQCTEREEILKGDVAGMAGPGKRMALLVACTVIYRDDLAERLLNKQRSPQYTGVRIPMIKSWPANQDLWNEYSNLRRQSQNEEIEEFAPTEFYKTNKEKMDDGAEVYWNDRVEPGFLSALEAAMASYFDDPRSFMAEKQNSPDEELDSNFTPLSAISVASRQGPYEKNELPHDCHYITTHVDVQQEVLFYMTVAWSSQFGGSILNYGSWPDQDRIYYGVRDLPKPLKRHPEYKSLDPDGRMRAAIKDCLDLLSTREYKNKDTGETMFLSRGLIDARYKSTQVEQAIIESTHKAMWIPAWGVGIGAKDTPLKLRQGLRGQHGRHWIIQKPKDRMLRGVFVDTNYWKSECYNALSIPIDHSHSIRLPKTSGRSSHQMVADHFCSERMVKVEAKGRSIEEWELPSNKPDNHHWDNLIGCMVAASTLGMSKANEVPLRTHQDKRRRKRNVRFKQ